MKIKLLSDYLRGVAAVSVLIVLPMLQTFSTRVATIVLVAALLACIGAVILNKKLKTLFYIPKFVNPFDSVIFLSISASLLWATISLFWGLDPERGILRIIFTILAIWGAWFLATQLKKLPIKRLQFVYVVGLVTTIVALYIGLWFVFDINLVLDRQNQRYDYNRVAVGLSLLVWSLVFLAARNFTYFVLCLFLFFSAVWCIFASESESAKLGIICGLAAATISCLHLTLRKIIFISLAASILTMPVFINQIEKTQSLLLPQAFSEAGHVHHRLQIWKGAADVALDRFWIGWGMKSDKELSVSGALGEYTQQAGFSARNWGPHNVALELWIDVGLVGMLCISSAILVGGFKSYDTKQHVFAYVGIQVTTMVMLLAGAGSSGFQGWLLAIISIASASCIALAPSRRPIETAITSCPK